MKTVYSYYVLDILHKGHLVMMKNSKSIAGKDGKLIIGILTDEAAMEKKSRPIIPFEERRDIADAIKYVDVVVPQQTYSPILFFLFNCPCKISKSILYSLIAFIKSCT